MTEGSYVTIVIEDVPEAIILQRDPQMPLLLWTLMEHENKMSVVHYTIKMQPEWETPIKYVERATGTGHGSVSFLGGCTDASLCFLIQFSKVQRASGVPHWDTHVCGAPHFLSAPHGLETQV